MLEECSFFLIVFSMKNSRSYPEIDPLLARVYVQNASVPGFPRWAFIKCLCRPTSALDSRRFPDGAGPRRCTAGVTPASVRAQDRRTEARTDCPDHQCPRNGRPHPSFPAPTRRPADGQQWAAPRKRVWRDTKKGPGVWPVPVVALHKIASPQLISFTNDGRKSNG